MILIAVDTSSNTAESEKTNNLIDEPNPDVMYHCLIEYFSLGNAIIKPRRWSLAKVCVTEGQFCKCLLQKHKWFTHVNVAALNISSYFGLLSYKLFLHNIFYRRKATNNLCPF